MAPLKASKLNLRASSGACVSKASWTIARGMKLNINIKSFLKRRMDSNANAVWTHLITASSGCEQKSDVNYCRKCFLIDSRKNAFAEECFETRLCGRRNMLQLMPLNGTTATRRKIAWTNISHLFSLRGFRLVQHKGPSCDCWVEFFRFFRFPLDPMPQLKFSCLFGPGQGGTAKACRVCGMDDKI